MIQDNAAAPLDAPLTALVESSVRAAGQSVYRMISGAGHDAMIIARRYPAAMLFLRSPGGISHHPDESVRELDVAAALTVGRKILEHWS
jgi:allantoate deiminase